jgi:hypothetical protein
VSWTDEMILGKEDATAILATIVQPVVAVLDVKPPGRVLP